MTNYERIEREIAGLEARYNPDGFNTPSTAQSLRLLLDVARAADTYKHLRDCNCGLCHALTALQEHCDDTHREG